MNIAIKKPHGLILINNAGLENKKLLILNGSHSEIPLILAARKLGLYVITAGNNASLIGHEYADEYQAVDYSDKEKTLDLALRLNIDYICSCANDFGIITAAYVAEKMSLPGHDSYETTTLLHHKDSFKEFALKNNLPVPYSVSFDDKEQACQYAKAACYPLIIKPVDLTGGKGVSIVHNTSDYLGAIDIAFKLSRQNRLVVEEYFSGTQHSFSTYLVDGKVVFSFSDNEFSYKNPYYVSCSAAPALGIEKYQQKLILTVEGIAEKLKLVNGIFHIQYLANNDDFAIIDITRRCSGDMYAYPVNYSTGIDWAFWIVKAELGLDCSNFPSVRQNGFYGRYCVMSDLNGIVSNVVIDDSLKPYICDSLFWWNKGDEIEDFLSQKVGIIFLKYNDMDEMIKITKQLPNLIKVII